VVLVTEWAEFRQLDMARLRAMMRTPVFVDGRNQFDPATMRQRGFLYAGVGRGHIDENTSERPAASAAGRVPLLAGN
jgi:UDPglucose 6-dehydrogenase